MDVESRSKDRSKVWNLENGWMVVPFSWILLEDWTRDRFEGHEIESLVLGMSSARGHLVRSGDVRWLVVCV